MVLVANGGTGSLDGAVLQRELTEGLGTAYYMAAAVTLVGALIAVVALGRRVGHPGEICVERAV
ncbi:hypothetical protein [Actinomadura sp. KC06]|uniref:hypothetical protein n=1 Tax=Actinomadura sp. KC06 TaxID=2530369 RepID=UPI0014046DAD|nr:hypothetical protein [Actinomadura sp. KC06]